MNHILEFDEDGMYKLHNLFHQIKKGQTILFLGAGASVTNKEYLSQDLIKLYEAKIGQSVGTDDIIEFIDILQSQGSFSRNNFDNFVEQLLRRLEPSEAHLQIATIPWNQIITTNYDVLVERAYEKVIDTKDSELELKVIRSKEESFYTIDGSQLKYTKLNGCISDKSRYPLVFSTKDFEDSNGYYKEALNNLKGLSDRISFISIGYSYQDKLATYLLKRFDQYNYRQRRVLYNIDPFISESRLEHFHDKNIRVVSLSMNDFFAEYKKWDENEGKSIVKAKKISFSDSKKNSIIPPPRLALKLDGVIEQLSDNQRFPYIKDTEYYLGEQPNYDTIRRGIDVKRESEIEKTIKKFKGISDSNFLIPIIIGKGSFGTGKTTLAYQVIDRLLKDTDFDCVAFEVKDYQKLKYEFLIELFKLTKAKNIVLYFDSAEIDTHYRKIAELRFDLSALQIDDLQIFMYVTIRENMLEKHKKSNELAESIEIKYNSRFEVTELEELIDRLGEKGLINFRDKLSRNDLVQTVKRNYDGDSFLTLANLLTKGNHRKVLLDAYDELTDVTKEAFLYTSLVYRFKIPLPADILLVLVSSNWDEFRKKVIEIGGKGLLFNEVNDSRNVDHDMVFKTKHSALSEILIEELLKKSDQYKYYHKLISVIESSHTKSTFVIDLLKALRKNQKLENSQINNLSDLGYSKFSKEPYYLLYYAMNLQRRRSLTDLKKAIDILYQGEALLEKRNHRFIHRRAAINFDLAKAYYKKEKTELDVTLKYVDEAEELFKIKQIFDPFSSFSYVDFIKFKMWTLRKIKFEEDGELKIKVHINELFDFALRAVRDNQGKILSLKSDFVSEFSFNTNQKKYEKELLSFYEESNESRPYALILLAQHYTDINNSARLNDCITELEQNTFIEEVAKFLFKYYGRRLYNTELRDRFFELLHENLFLEKQEPLRYNYYKYIAESYSSNFSRSHTYLKNIKFSFGFINPDYNEVWKDEDGYELIFDAKVIRDRGNLVARVEYFPKNFYIDKRSQNREINLYDKITVQLNFYLFGIKAEIIDE